MKTLEDLGYEFYSLNTNRDMYQFINKEQDILWLYGDGDYNCDGYLNQELHRAIELKMKELGYWK